MSYDQIQLILTSAVFSLGSVPAVTLTKPPQCSAHEKIQQFRKFKIGENLFRNYRSIAIYSFARIQYMQ